MSSSAIVPSLVQKQLQEIGTVIWGGRELSTAEINHAIRREKDLSRWIRQSKIPRILDYYLDITGQYDNFPLSLNHLLHEGDICLYAAYEDKDSDIYAVYSPASKAALRRFCNSLREMGAVPERDFD